MRSSNIRQTTTRRTLLAAAAGLALAACADRDDPAQSGVQEGTATLPVPPSDPMAAASAALDPTASVPDEPTPEPHVGLDGLFTETLNADDGTQYLIPPESIRSGGVARDGIPSIDEPQFASSDIWDSFGYREDELVIGVEVGGVRRAYPFQVLVWHELVNDTIGDVPMLISYCPLCGSAIAFERVVGGDAVEFGVSGLLYNSDLLMYDREAESLWSQITGTAVAGERVGTRLSFYPSEIMTWGDWKMTYPDSQVLTTETGAARDYSRDPYGDYYFDKRLLFPVNESSAIYDVLPLKVSVTGVEVAGPAYGAFVSRDVREVGVVNEFVGDVAVVVAPDAASGDNIVVFAREANQMTLTFMLADGGLRDEETGSLWSFDGQAVDGELAGAQLIEIVPVKSYWFAWVAFHPNTTLWMLPA